jgi:hypothetical protein
MVVKNVAIQALARNESDTFQLLMDTRQATGVDEKKLQRELRRGCGLRSGLARRAK